MLGPVDQHCTAFRIAAGCALSDRPQSNYALTGIALLKFAVMHRPMGEIVEMVRKWGVLEDPALFAPDNLTPILTTLRAHDIQFDHVFSCSAKGQSLNISLFRLAARGKHLEAVWLLLDAGATPVPGEGGEAVASVVDTFKAHRAIQKTLEQVKINALRAASDTEERAPEWARAARFHP